MSESFWLQTSVERGVTDPTLHGIFWTLAKNNNNVILPRYQSDCTHTGVPLNTDPAAHLPPRHTGPAGYSQVHPDHCGNHRDLWKEALLHMAEASIITELES